jgi:hypothetical protein
MSTKRIDNRIKVQPSEKAYPKLLELANKKEWSLPKTGEYLFDVALGIKKASK